MEKVKKRSYEIDMSKGNLLKNILAFVVPIIVGNMLQLCYNAADLIVVSNFAGSNAMASVGATGNVSGMIINVCVGISAGASVVVSRRFGARDDEAMHTAVHTSMLLGILIGFIPLFIGVFFARPILSIMGIHERAVLDGAVLYMRIFFLGVPASMVYNFGASILRAVGDSRRPLYILSVSGIINVILNLVLVIVFHLDVAGVAIATVVSNYASALAVLIILIKSDGSCKLVLSKLRIYKAELKEILRIGIPTGLQSSVFGLSNTVIQSAVNSFGTAAMAGRAACSNIEAFVYMAMYSFSTAAITGVSQNAGAGDGKRVKKTIIVCIICAFVAGIMLGSLVVIFSRQLMGIYIKDSPQAIEFGMQNALYVCIPYFLCGIMDVLSGSLRGLGYSVVPAINSFVGACGLRILWIMFILPLNRTPFMLFLCWPVTWVVVIILHLVYFALIRKSLTNRMLSYK